MTQEPLWRMIGQSVRGASHHRAGLPNQDALTCLPATGSGPPLILAVSDGHGSAKSFRSDRGSRFAAATVAELMRELVDGQLRTPNLSAIKRVSEERLPRELVRRWQDAVEADLQRDPFSDEELSRLVAQRGDRGQQEVLANPRLAYGATAIGVLVERDFLLFLQLGDGDILTVTDAGVVSRPFPRDSRLIANETTSLCMDRAWQEVRLHFQARYGTPPALILAATDGYANSFVNDAAFVRVGSDILEILRRDGVKAVVESLGDWLREASEAGSGDDITLGILYRTDALGGGGAGGEAPGREARLAVPETSEGVDTETEAGVAVEPSGEDTTATAAAQAAARGTETDPVLRSRMLAQLKHKGPSEPAKQGRLRDLVDSDDGASTE
ncbi:MAG: protein phosphatase 2C domain-containing protein [Anaerolineae bacterium]|nr:protein phosphatase 2C domain-containing protein [Anaerolineae bacterium]